MTIFYILLAAVVSYGLLLLFKQQALLKDRVTDLERQKQETEEILLRFMEQVNGLAEREEQPTADAPAQSSYETVVSPDVTELPQFEQAQEESAESVQPVLTDVKDQLAAGADLDQLARSLNRGTGEVALIAKLSSKTKVARR
ncbi:MULTISPECIES: hypothetical protein [unclassified Exiguobacterium]|uniref:hypothetical protein n=1 Tax=unclassified Exiguobacterium TaxID=2644629 RepID=UPI001BEC3EFA|nr:MULTISPECIES: hypothetical protein [unclassified Exiguobacterium]